MRREITAIAILYIVPAVMCWIMFDYIMCPDNDKADKAFAAMCVITPVLNILAGVTLFIIIIAKALSPILF